MNNKVLSLLGLCMKAGFLSTGEVAVESAIKSGKANIVILANDASSNTIKKFENSTKFYNIKLIRYSKKEELGRGLGKAERSVLAVCNHGFANKLITIIENDTQ